MLLRWGLYLEVTKPLKNLLSLLFNKNINGIFLYKKKSTLISVLSILFDGILIPRILRILPSKLTRVGHLWKKLSESKFSEQLVLFSDHLSYFLIGGPLN
jgi:hypothetical protein